MITERHAAGATIAELSREFEVGAATIWRALHANVARGSHSTDVVLKPTLGPPWPYRRGPRARQRPLPRRIRRPQPRPIGSTSDRSAAAWIGTGSSGKLRMFRSGCLRAGMSDRHRRPPPRRPEGLIVRAFLNGVESRRDVSQGTFVLRRCSANAGLVRVAPSRKPGSTARPTFKGRGCPSDTLRAAVQGPGHPELAGSRNGRPTRP